MTKKVKSSSLSFHSSNIIKAPWNALWDHVEYLGLLVPVKSSPWRMGNKLTSFPAIPYKYKATSRNRTREKAIP